MRTNSSLKITGLVLGSWLILFSTSAVAQSTLASASAVGQLGPVCGVQEVAKASCSGKWSGGSYGASGSYSVSATAKYGELTGRAVSKVKATEATGQSTYSDTQPTQFVDMLSFPTLPDGTLATLSATVQLTGVSSVSNASSSSQVQAYEFLGSSSSCSIEAVGTCTTSIPWEGGGGSAEFHLSLLVNAFAELDATGSASASGDYQAKITALTMTDANGITYEIVAASGHKYPK